MQKSVLVSLLLRLALAIPFLYAGIDSFIHPDNWMGYLSPRMLSFVEETVGLKLFLVGYAVFEILLGLVLVAGKFIKIAALVSSALLLGIIVSNFGQFSVIFRDAGLFFAALALLFLPRD